MRERELMWAMSLRRDHSYHAEDMVTGHQTEEERREVSSAERLRQRHQPPRMAADVVDEQQQQREEVEEEDSAQTETLPLYLGQRRTWRTMTTSETVTERTLEMLESERHHRVVDPGGSSLGGQQTCLQTRRPER